jgi:hypothetical protein
VGRQPGEPSRSFWTWHNPHRVHTYCSNPVTALANDFSATISAHSTSVSMISLLTCSWRRPLISMDQSSASSLCHRSILICCMQHHARNPEGRPDSFTLGFYASGSIGESPTHEAFVEEVCSSLSPLYCSILLLVAQIHVILMALRNCFGN